MNQKVVQVEGVAEFVAEVGKLEQRHVAQWFYRGHADAAFKLIPSLFRLNREGLFAEWVDVERYMMESFRCESAPFLEHRPENEAEWLALAQHYGVPTRLLDWTTNPLVALYFAVESHDDCNADVWCIGFHSTHNCMPENTYLARRLTLFKEKMIYFPRHISPRMTNRSGCFTVHDDPAPLDELGLDSIFRLTRVQMRMQQKVYAQ